MHAVTRTALLAFALFAATPVASLSGPATLAGAVRAEAAAASAVQPAAPGVPAEPAAPVGAGWG